MKRRLTSGAAFVAMIAIGTSAAQAEGICADADGASFICGVKNVEDLVVLPGEKWVLGSDLAGAGNQGYLWLFNRDHSVRPIDPSEISTGSGGGDKSCPGVPDWSVFEPHGLGFRGDGNRGTLVAINHGGRETLEFFDVSISDAGPAITWTGCTTAPDGAWPDDLAVMPDGSLVVTSLWDPQDDTRVDKLVGGKPVGGMFKWTRDAGWSPVPGFEKVSGPNGIIATPDGEDIYVAAWSGKKLVHAKMAELPEIEEIDMDFPPDNLNWSMDGNSILATGVTGSILDALKCFGSDKVNCPELGVRVDRYDPANGSVSSVIPGGVYGELGAATGAIQIGNELWVSTFRGDRIAVFPSK